MPNKKISKWLAAATMATALTANASIVKAHSLENNTLPNEMNQIFEKKIELENLIHNPHSTVEMMLANAKKWELRNERLWTPELKERLDKLSNFIGVIKKTTEQLENNFNENNSIYTHEEQEQMSKLVHQVSSTPEGKEIIKKELEQSFNALITPELISSKSSSDILRCQTLKDKLEQFNFSTSSPEDIAKFTVNYHRKLKETKEIQMLKQKYKQSPQYQQIAEKYNNLEQEYQKKQNQKRGRGLMLRNSASDQTKAELFIAEHELLSSEAQATAKAVNQVYMVQQRNKYNVNEKNINFNYLLKQETQKMEENLDTSITMNFIDELKVAPENLTPLKSSPLSSSLQKQEERE